MSFATTALERLIQQHLREVIASDVKVIHAHRAASPPPTPFVTMLVISDRTQCASSRLTDTDDPEDAELYLGALEQSRRVVVSVQAYGARAYEVIEQVRAGAMNPQQTQRDADRGLTVLEARSMSRVPAQLDTRWQDRWRIELVCTHVSSSTFSGEGVETIEATTQGHTMTLTTPEG